MTTSFKIVWARWQKLRELNRQIESAWSGVELLLRYAPEGPDHGFEGTYDIFETLGMNGRF